MIVSADVHDPLAIRLAHPYLGATQFPALVSTEFTDALQGQTQQERKHGDFRSKHGVFERQGIDSEGKTKAEGFGMYETRLQRLATDNPIATTLAFNHRLENVRENLIGRSKKRLTNEPLLERSKGMWGINSSNHDVKETNDRASMHEHGQAHGGLSPALIADLAADPVLRQEAMKALDTQVCGELPIEYHAAYLAQERLRVSKRRDSAYDMPTLPSKDEFEKSAEYAAERIRHVGDYKAYLEQEWWPDFRHHAYVVVMNRHTHEHMKSCNKTDRGQIGCRFCAPWPHNVKWTQCLELRPWPTDGTPAPASQHDDRCPVCFARKQHDRRKNSELSNSERELLYEDEARRRDLCFTLHDPSLPGNRVDERTLSVEIRRRLLPIVEEAEGDRGAVAMEVDGGSSERVFTDALEKLVHQGTEARCPWSYWPCNERAWRDLPDGQRESESDGKYDQRIFAKARCTLRELLETGQKLQVLCAHPGFAALRHRIEKLAADPPSHVEDSEKHAREEKQRFDELRGLLDDWTWTAVDAPKRPCVMACRNAIIADFTIVLAGCIKSNAVPYHLGAGAGSKAAAMYQIKYMGKDSVEISASANVLVEAHNYVRDELTASTANDTGEPERIAKHFAQHVINCSNMELEATQAAGIVLGIASSGGSDNIEYLGAWDLDKVASAAAQSELDVDLSHVPDEDEAADDADRPELATDTEEDDSDAEQDWDTERAGCNVACGVGCKAACSTDCTADGTVDCHTACGTDCTAICTADCHAEHTKRALFGQRPRFCGPCNASPSGDEKQGDADAEGNEVSEREPEIDLLQHFHMDGGNCEGSSRTYHDAQGNPVAVAAAHHYAYRDTRLACFNAHEFHRVFHVRKMDSKQYPRDRIWHRVQTRFLPRLRGAAHMLQLVATGLKKLQLVAIGLKPLDTLDKTHGVVVMVQRRWRHRHGLAQPLDSRFATDLGQRVALLLHVRDLLRDRIGGSIMDERPAILPLTPQNAKGRNVLVARTRWPDYDCNEHDGAGWEAKVVKATPRWAFVDFTYARDQHGARYKREWIKLDELQPLADKYAPERRGRSCERYVLHAPHPLHDSYILVRRAKWGVPAPAGKPPPSEPDLDKPNTRARQTAARNFARYYSAVFIPWTAWSPPGRSYQHWIDHVDQLEEDACLYRPREEDGDEPARRKRLIAAGRLFDIDNLKHGFKAPKVSSTMGMKRRSRYRTFWNDENRPPVSESDSMNGEQRSAAKEIQKLREKAERMRAKKDIATRLNEANAAKAAADLLRAQLPSHRAASASVAGSKLSEMWKSAASPAYRTTRGISRDVREVSRANGKPMPARDVTPLHEKPNQLASGMPPPWLVTNPTTLPTDCPFAEISGTDYDRAADEWKASKDAGLPVGKPPLNPEQRDGGRDFLRMTRLRAGALQRGESVESIAQAVSAEGLSPVTLAMGAGGTGKSEMVHELDAQMRAMGCGHLLVTAYTGVAAAPFKGPTLLSVFNLGVESKNSKRIEQMSHGRREAARKKFRDECGVEIDDIGGIVIDEVSFNELEIFGHLDGRLRQLTGNVDVLCGGIPVLLCGDNHQKPPTNNCPWYKDMVKNAEEQGELLKGGPTTSKARGLELLQAARRVQLWRNMRARFDQAFVKVQEHMRNTDVERPVPVDFVRGLRKVSTKDLNDDEEWRFAPVGVLQREERDVINVAQAEAFACTFGLPLIRWRLDMVDEIDNKLLRDDVYDDEDHLWGYFVEGAPVNLTENMSSTRGLVNGSAGILDSLSFVGGVIPPELQAAEANAASRRGVDVVRVDLAEAPLSVNVRVGGKKSPPGQSPGSAPGSVLWHGIELDDLSGVIESIATDGAQVVSLLMSTHVKKEAVPLRGLVAAQNNLAEQVKIAKQHPYRLAFALTVWDFD